MSGWAPFAHVTGCGRTSWLLWAPVGWDPGSGDLLQNYKVHNMNTCMRFETILLKV